MNSTTNEKTLREYLHHSGENSNALSPDQIRQAWKIADGYGQLNDDGVEELLWDWSHIRDSSDEAKAELVTFVRSCLPNGAPVLKENLIYRGLIIKPKQDFGPDSNETGFVITDGCCNVMPGATWARTIEQAIQLINCYIEAGGRVQKNGEKYILYITPPEVADRFWELVKAGTP